MPRPQLLHLSPPLLLLLLPPPSFLPSFLPSHPHSFPILPQKACFTPSSRFSQPLSLTGMEKKQFFCANSQSPEAVLPAEVNCGAAAGQLPQPFLSVGWEHLMQHGPRFESALSSLVPPLPPSSNQLVCELVDRLGGVCSSGDISTTLQYQNAGPSRYSALLSSPPKLNPAVMDHQPMPGSQMVGGQFAAPFATNPGFAERAARFSCLGTRCYDGLRGQFGLPDIGNLSSAPISQSLKADGALPLSIPDNGKEAASTPTPEETEFNNVQEAATPSDTMLTGSAENNAKKRRAATKGKGKAPPLSSSNTNPPKEMEEENYEAKRCRTAETSEAERTVRTKPKTEQSNDNEDQKQGKENNAKPPEPPRDYIHVRARRGQATDSHSLAERVRREKISERMKLLQDLVPGCNKITGKALMLDEIINYVQSLQRQVEFLSTKLATLNPHLDFNIDSLLRKDTHQEDGRLAEQIYPQLDLASTAFSYAQQPQSLGMKTPLNNPSVSSLDPLDGFAGAIPQLESFWEDDLQYVVQSAFSSQGLCAE